MPKEKGIIDYVSWTGAVQNIFEEDWGRSRTRIN